MGPRVRFDDVQAGSAFTLNGIHTVVEAATLDEVVPAIAEVERLVADGCWAAGFVAYEAAPAFDSALRVRRPDGPLPLVWFALSEDRRDEVPLTARVTRPAPYSVSTWTPSLGRGDFEDAFAAIRAHIAAGDTYQVNHTFRLRAAFGGDPFEFYRDIVLSQRGAYAAYLDLGRHHVASASPELFFERSGEALVTKPMKGTIARGRWPAEDEARAAALAASQKDRSENLMIVDLLRNDLGRIAEFGSVMVHRLFELERYETVWQLTSTIAGSVSEKVGLVDVLRALFPCGSVTGAPKARTMELISELEDSPRGVYCGAIGYLAPPGAPGPSARFNVAIRTVTIDSEEGVAEYGVGGGITWDSRAAGEYDESRAKAQVLVQRRPDFDLLETLRWEPGEGLLWRDRHLRRMEGSAGYFGFGWDGEAVASALDRVVAGLDDAIWRVRLTVDRSGDANVTVGRLPADVQAPARLAVDGDPVHSGNVFLFHKTTYRREYEQRAQSHPGVDDVVLVNQRGEVTETTIANLAVHVEGRWVTPPLDSGCLPGIYREVLLEQGRVVEQVVTLADLRRADALAVLNSVRLWQPARLADSASVGVGGGSGAPGAQ